MCGWTKKLRSGSRAADRLPDLPRRICRGSRRKTAGRIPDRLPDLPPRSQKAAPESCIKTPLLKIRIFTGFLRPARRRIVADKKSLRGRRHGGRPKNPQVGGCVRNCTKNPHGGQAINAGFPPLLPAAVQSCTKNQSVVHPATIRDIMNESQPEPLSPARN